MAQNKYRVTFISPSEVEQRTVMAASSLPDLIRKVESIIADPNGYFVNDKNNWYFKVIKDNVAFIQYELLFSDKEIHIEKLKHIAPAILKQLFKNKWSRIICTCATWCWYSDERICARRNGFGAKNKSRNGAEKVGSNADRNCRSTRSVVRGTCFVYTRLIVF